MYRAITCNTNGIRAANRKGFFEWLATQNADVVCIQETKAQEHQLVDDVFRPEGYHCYYNDAERKGYSGTALVPCVATSSRASTRSSRAAGATACRASDRGKEKRRNNE